MRAFILCLGFLWLIFPHPARAAAAAPETAALHVLLMDAQTGRTLFEKAADTPFPPASMSKLMTMLMVFERLRSGSLKLDDPIIISENAWKRGGANSGGSTMYALVNKPVRLTDLMHGIMIQSANDAAIAVAEHIAGSEEAFAQMMTKRAHELGLKNAQFRNATGLYDPAHVMTARELALLAEYIIRSFPEFYAWYGQPEFTWNNITQANRNPLLKDYPGADGVKTGYVKESGYGLVGSAVRNGRRLILVVSGLNSIADRKAEARKLLDWGFAQYRAVSAYQPGEKVGRARVWGGSRSHADLIVKDGLQLMLSADEMAEARAELTYKGPLVAPVAAGVQVGMVRVRVGNRVVAEAPAYVSEAVDEAPEMWRKALDGLLIRSFGG